MNGPKPRGWEELCDIRQLACLIRANVVLAQMSGRSSSEHMGYVLKAYYSSLRLIQVAVENASQSWKEIQKLNAQAAEQQAAGGQQEKEKKTKQPPAVSVNESGKKSNLGGDGGGRGKQII